MCWLWEPLSLLPHFKQLLQFLRGNKGVLVPWCAFSDVKTWKYFIPYKTKKKGFDIDKIPFNKFDERYTPCLLKLPKIIANQCDILVKLIFKRLAKKSATLYHDLNIFSGLE